MLFTSQAYSGQRNCAQAKEYIYAINRSVLITRFVVSGDPCTELATSPVDRMLYSLSLLAGISTTWEAQKIHRIVYT